MAPKKSTKKKNQVKVKIEPNECSLVFRSRESEDDAMEFGMSLSDHVKSVWGSKYVDMDIEPKIEFLDDKFGENGIKKEPEEFSSENDGKNGENEKDENDDETKNKMEEENRTQSDGQKKINQPQPDGQGNRNRSQPDERKETCQTQKNSQKGKNQSKKHLLKNKNQPQKDMPKGRKRPQEKTFECEKCKKKCKGNYELNQHKRIHTDIRAFECKICNVKKLLT